MEIIGAFAIPIVLGWGISSLIIRLFPNKKEDRE